MIFGRAEMREMVKKLIEEVDIPTGEFETKVFKLKHADPDEIKENLEGLYEKQAGRFSSYGFRRYGSRTVDPRDTVKVISFPTMQQVTVIASPENMTKIAEQIAEWDVPIDVEAVKPRIIELHNSDPVQMADLLTTLFSEEARGRLSFFDLYFGRGGEKKKIVGALYGQLTFEDVPGTRKIIIISKIPEAYDVIEELIRELDKQEMAEVPKVVTLNYADPEELAERLNAMFNKPGTVAKIRLGERGLSEYSMQETDDEKSKSDKDDTAKGEYTPWWSGSGARDRIDEEMPISNVIGRIRFIPDRRSKAILVLAPREFMDNIEEMIKELDVPGKQVMIKAIILEVDHSNMTSLGLQLSSSIGKWETLDNENAITALTGLTVLEERGSFTFSAVTDIAAMIDFLVKKVDAKILNQQTLWTKDNEEADFFKGKRVAFLKGSTISPEGRVTSQNVEFKRVGMTLRVRPSITPEKKVDMTINLVISQLTSERENDQPVRTEMDTETTLIVRDGETIMLGGMLFRKDSIVERKVPLLGDIPLVGGLFRHNEVIEANTEMLVFITPYVIDEDPDKMLPETREEIERPKEKLEDVLEQLEAVLGDGE
jgi:general secretion pathway protein D